MVERPDLGGGAITVVALGGDAAGGVETVGVFGGAEAGGAAGIGGAEDCPPAQYVCPLL